MIIDTHCHYNLDPLWEDWNAHWIQAQNHGVGASIVVGTTKETSAQAITIAQQQPRLFAAIGYHPSYYQEYIEELVRIKSWPLSPNKLHQKVTTDLTELQDMFDPTTVVALGETGLDYFRLPKDTTQQQVIKQLQQQALTEHLKLASKYQVSVILHVRDQQVPEVPTPGNAYWDTLDLVRAHLTQGNQLLFILHCVSGPLSYVHTMVELGGYIGIAGNVTYPSANHIRTLVTSVPTSKLLLETDAPYLPPQSSRGKTCQPYLISETAQFVYQLTNTTPEQLITNTYTLFPKLQTATID
jgi:TatD DNase family protein